MPRRMVLRLAPVAGTVWAVAFTAVMIPDAAPALAGVLWAAAALALTAGATGASRRRRLLGGQVLAIAVFALAGAAAAASQVALAQPAREAVADLSLGGGRAIAVHATVAGKVEPRAGGSVAFDAMALRIDRGSASHPIEVPVVIEVVPSGVEGWSALDVGAVVEARGTARPGMLGDRAVLSVRATRGVTVVQPPAGLLAVTADLRRGLVASVAGLPGPGAGLVPGLAVGDTSAVSERLDAQLKESSLSHLTAVSGANCALVVGIAYGIAAACGARRSLRAACGLVVLGGFVLLVTPEPSVLRAATMAAIAMLCVLRGRAGAGMAVLSLSVAALLIADPWLASSLGFALSSAATASLLLFARPLADGLSRRIPRALALALAVPLAAQLACGPLLVLITPVVPAYGVVANLLAAPAAPLATIVGLAACLAAPLPVLQDGLAWIAWLPASWIAATAATVTSLPGDLVPWLGGWPGVLALSAVGAAVGVLIAVRRTDRRRVRVLRGAATVVVSLVVGIAAGGAALVSVAGRWTLPAGWSVLACDVGQGDAVLLRSADTVMLIDTGPAPEPLSSCLDRAGIARIDVLVLTHFDLDHVGGASAVAGRVGTVLHGPADDTARGGADAILADLADAGADLVGARSGMTGTLGDARWRVLWPAADSRAFPGGNDASVVIDIRGGGIPPSLMLGDLSASPQRAVAASGALDPPYALVKVAHHGSADQDAALYRTAAPLVAVVTVGAENRYGHPRAEILTTLDALGARMLRTDRDGVVAVSPVAGGWELWRERGGRVGGDG